MAVKKLKDGRWIVYYRILGQKNKWKKEYFGRGLEAERKARDRHHEILIPLLAAALLEHNT